jgi:hypothetical protein
VSTKGDQKFIPELWSTEMLSIRKTELVYNFPKRSYGDRLLRAAAKGEDWTKIKRVEDPHETYTDDAADALAYAVDRDILNIFSNRSGS